MYGYRERKEREEVKPLLLRRYTGQSEKERRSPDGLVWEIVKDKAEVIITRPEPRGRGAIKIEFIEPNFSLTIEEWRQLSVLIKTGKQPLTGKEVYKDKESKLVKRCEEEKASLQKKVTSQEQLIHNLRESVKGEK